MPDLTTTKTYADGVPIAATDLNALIPQTSLATTCINGRTSGGVVQDADQLLIFQASSSQLRSSTAAAFKTYLGQVFVPSQYAVNSGLTITGAGNVLSPTWTQQIGAITFTTIVARRLMGWMSLTWVPLSGTTSLDVHIYRQDNTDCGHFQFMNPGLPVGVGNGWSISFQWVDGATLAGSTTYYALCFSAGANSTVNACVFSAVQI